MENQIRITNHGSVWSFLPLTQEARDWIAKNVSAESWQWHGRALVVEARFAVDLVCGLQAAGLVS